MKHGTDQTRRIDPGMFCRMGNELVECVRDQRDSHRIITNGVLVVLLGTMMYGFVFGVWRSPLQGLYAALKMPVLFLATVLTSATANTMLAQVFGAKLSFQQVCICMLIGLAVAASLLGAVSTVVLFIISQLSAAGTDCVGLDLAASSSQPVVGVYWWLLIMHVSVIGVAGIVGNLKLYHLLVVLEIRKKLSIVLMLAWIGVSGFVGCELSWLLSPFLCSPTEEPHFMQQGYFEENFYERMWRATKVCAGR
jgi:hypothetical protein